MNKAYILHELRASHNGRATLLVPPQAGHDYKLLMWPNKANNMAECALEHFDGGVYIIEWLSCTHERRNESYEDLVMQLHECVDTIAVPYLQLVGVCQGGTLAAIFASIFPWEVQDLVISSAPIDVRAAPGILDKAIDMPLYKYQLVVAMGGGRMLGQIMLASWKSSDAKKHYWDRYFTTSDRQDMFYDWYDRVLHLSGGWYLYLIEHLFQGNKLIKNEFILFDEPVVLSDITAHTTVLTGTQDTITPPPQTLAMRHDLHYSVDAGHIGVSMGSEAIRDVLPLVFGRVTT